MQDIILQLERPGTHERSAWTLEPDGQGTLLRLEHSNIPAQSKQAYHGAKAGWPRLLSALAALLDGQAEPIRDRSAKENGT